MVSINLTWINLYFADTPSKVLHAYDETLKASKEKEQQLQTEVHTLKQISWAKDQQISMLYKELQGKQNITSLRYQFDEQQRELEMLQQKGIYESWMNVADSVV